MKKSMIKKQAEMIRELTLKNRILKGHCIDYDIQVDHLIDTLFDCHKHGDSKIKRIIKKVVKFEFIKG